MKTVKINTKSIFDISNINLAIGNFDGVHIGHQKIIQKLTNESKKINAKSAILCFDPHPRQYFTKSFKDFTIIDEETKINLFKYFNIDFYIILKFNSVLASLSPHEFIKNILFRKLKVKHLTVGHDFKFGKDRKGDINLLKQLSSKYNYKISIIDPVLESLSLKIYSSSLVRQNIKEGNFEKVTSLLGRNWTMKGNIIQGEQRAAKMNFPTANIVPWSNIKPKKGVYAIKAILDNEYYNGIANFGKRPTVNGNNLLLEVHLFDFDQNIYGKELTVEFLTFIRDEKKFNNFTLLIEQIRKDIKLVKIYHSKK